MFRKESKRTLLFPKEHCCYEKLFVADFCVRFPQAVLKTPNQKVYRLTRWPSPYFAEHHNIFLKVCKICLSLMTDPHGPAPVVYLTLCSGTLKLMSRPVRVTVEQSIYLFSMINSFEKVFIEFDYSRCQDKE